MNHKPIIAYATTTGDIVHATCLHLFQRPHREKMETAGPGGKPTNITPPDYPGVKSAWHPGHPSLPRECAHCHETIARGTEVI